MLLLLVLLVLPAAVLVVRALTLRSATWGLAVAVAVVRESLLRLAVLAVLVVHTGGLAAVVVLALTWRVLVLRVRVVLALRVRRSSLPRRLRLLRGFFDG
jgi:hypothetical protein